MLFRSSFTNEMAYLTIYDTDSDAVISFTSPMSSAALKGCHDVQNLGAVQTYLRRYLWTNAFEICEHDALDATTGSVEPAKKPEPKPSPKVDPKPVVGQKGEWQMVLTPDPNASQEDYLKLVDTTASMLLDLTVNEEDVMQIFKKNKVLFDKVKAMDPEFFKGLMASFTERKNLLTQGN